MDPSAPRARREPRPAPRADRPGGDVTCLVSGGADSTCLWHVLRGLGYAVSALHVDHGLRGEESAADARFCAEALGAEVVASPPARSEAELRALRYAVAGDRLRATGHTASDQVETVLYRLVVERPPDGDPGPARRRRRPAAAAALARRDGGVLPRAKGSSSASTRRTPETKRGLIRDEILPLLRRLHPAADENLLRALDERRPLPPALAELLDAPAGSKRVDLGGGCQAVREHDRLWLERGPVGARRPVEWGGWRIASELPGLRVRGWRPGDRLAGR